jgi:acyl-coenzyme A thioesterase PaaI-like protein
MAERSQSLQERYAPANALEAGGSTAPSGDVNMGPSRRLNFSIEQGTARSTMNEKSLQEKYAPDNSCWGCGPANRDGLRIRSFAKNGEVVAEWKPQSKYEAFPGVLNGGIIGTLLDCHCNWTAAYHLMKRAGVDHPPCTVTAEYSIKLLRPTPTSTPISLSARIVDLSGERATIEGTLSAGGKVCATCRGIFVAVKEGHPAYHRW